MSNFSLEYPYTPSWGGSAFDFGREPTEDSSFEIVRENKIRPVYIGGITIEAVGADTAQDFYKNVCTHLHSMTYNMTEVTLCILPKKPIYCRIIAPVIEWTNDHEANISFQFEELY